MRAAMLTTFLQPWRHSLFMIIPILLPACAENICNSPSLEHWGLYGGHEGKVFVHVPDEDIKVWACGERDERHIDAAVWHIDLEPNFKLSVRQLDNNFDSVAQLVWPSGGHQPCSWWGTGALENQCVDDPDSRVLEYSNHGSNVITVNYMLGVHESQAHYPNSGRTSFIEFSVEEDHPKVVDEEGSNSGDSMRSVFYVFLVIFGGCCLCLCCMCYNCAKGVSATKEKLWGDEEVEEDPEAPLFIQNAQVPPNWVNQDLFGEEFDEYYPVDIDPFVQEMFDQTWKDIVTRDRKGGKAPSGLEVTSVTRFEDQQMWAKYVREREKIRKQRGSIQPICMLDGNPTTGAVKTDDFNHMLSGSQGLDASVNEHYLFHGTSPDAAANIAENGFRINLAGSNAGILFGKGAYFAECSSKADEYATTGSGPLQQLGRFGSQEEDEYAMLVCRVVMGKPMRAFRSGDKPKILAGLKNEQIDSVVGDREEAVGTYREFIVYREAQVYPEYRVLYKRRFEDEEE